MKKPILIVATAAMLIAGTAASAQPYGGPYNAPGYERRDHDRRYDRDRHDDRYWREHRYSRGERFEHWRGRDYIVDDYRRYGWRRPPRGYAYYRADNGDVVLAAIATGIITSIIVGGMNDHDHYPPPRR